MNSAFSKVQKYKSSGENMRKVIDMQMRIGEVAIDNITFDPRSRDEIPELLMGLQSIYCNREIREQVFEVLMDLVPDDVDPNNGRSGMGLWKILVLGTLRLSCNWYLFIEIASCLRMIYAIAIVGRITRSFSCRAATSTFLPNDER